MLRLWAPGTRRDLVAERWTGDAEAPSALAPQAYAERARIEAAAVMPRLSHEARRILELAQDGARLGDSDHLGTEHIVLGIIAHEPGSGSTLLRSLSVSRQVFLEQLHEEDGHAPDGPIPLTARSLMVVAIAGSCTEGPVAGMHLLQGVMAESDDWRAAGRPGPHHLRKACDAAGLTWKDLARAVAEQLQQDRSGARALHVRVAGRGDLATLLSIHAAHRADMPSIDPPSQAEEATWDRMMSTEDLTVYLADLGGEAVGTATVMVMPNVTYECAPTVFIEAVVVVPQHRREGVATAILDRIVDDSRAAGCNKVQLLSHKRHATDGAHALYVTAGFVAEAEGFRRHLRE